MVHCHDDNVDEHNQHDEAVEPGIIHDATCHSAWIALLSPGHQVLPFEEHGSQELDVEYDVRRDIGRCPVSRQDSFLVVNLQMCESGETP